MQVDASGPPLPAGGLPGTPRVFLEAFSQPPSSPYPGLTGFEAGRGHSSGRRPDAHNSGPSTHRWCQWHCRGSRGWASRLEEEVFRGQWKLASRYLPCPLPGIYNFRALRHRGPLGPLSLQPSSPPLTLVLDAVSLMGCLAACAPTSRVPMSDL